MSVASVGWWVGNIVSGEISPFLLSSSLGTAGTLLLDTIICALIFIFVLLLLPETKVKVTLYFGIHLGAFPSVYSIVIELYSSF